MSGACSAKQTSADVKGRVQHCLSFSLPPGDMALSMAARFYIYGAGTVSKSTFDDPHCRAMCQAYYEAGGGRTKAPFLSRKGVLSFVQAEFSLLLNLMSFMGQLCYTKAQRNPFVQQVHDGATSNARVDTLLENVSMRVNIMCKLM